MIMRHRDIGYYVGWLSAAAIHGAAHQAPQVFQVAVDRQIRDRTVGRTRFVFAQREVADIPTIAHPTRDRSARVSTVAVTMLDVADDMLRAAGIDNAATVIVELSEHESFDATDLARLAPLFPAAAGRRVGRSGVTRCVRASVLRFVGVGKQVPPNPFSELGTARILQLLGQIGIARALEPVPAHPYRNLGDQFWCQLIHQNEKLVRRKGLVRRFVLAPREVGDIGGQQDVCTASDCCGVDVGVERILALVVVTDLEVVDPADLERLGDPVSDAGNPAAAPIGMSLAQVVQHFGEHVLRPAHLEWGGVGRGLEHADPVPERAGEPDIGINEDDLDRGTLHGGRLANRADSSRRSVLVAFEFQEFLERCAFTGTTGAQGSKYVLGPEPMMRADHVRRDRTLVDHLHKRGARDTQDARSSRSRQNFWHSADCDCAAARHHIQDMLEELPDLGRNRKGTASVPLHYQHASRAFQLGQDIAGKSRLVGAHHHTTRRGLSGSHRSLRSKQHSRTERLHIQL